MAYSNVHLPRGYEVAIQTDPSVPGVYTDLGVTYDDGTLEFSYDTTKWTGSQGEKLKTFFQNMAVTASFTLAQLNLANIHKLMSGGAGLVNTSGVLVSGATQTIASGAWNYDAFIPIANQNGSGAEVVVNSVTLGTDGAIVEGTDYIKAKVAGVWGIVILDSIGVTTEAQSVVINYDYTPNASTGLTVGSSSVDITPRSLRIRKSNSSGKYFTAFIYAAVNEAGLSMSFPRWDSTDPVTLPVSMVGQLDENRTDLDQLFSIVDEGF